MVMGKWFSVGSAYYLRIKLLAEGSWMVRFTIPEDILRVEFCKSAAEFAEPMGDYM
jgi:hypothetical protein